MARCQVTDKTIFQEAEDIVESFNACGDINVKDALDSQVMSTKKGNKVSYK